jgi:hypothetical protein
MKCLIAVNLVVIGLCCQLGLAQTNDTYSILKTLDGATYTNAEISSVTAAYAIVFYDTSSNHMDICCPIGRRS